jgi:hypothetical protein
MKAEEILEMHFGSEFWKLEELDYKTNIINAMQEYARIQIEKDRERIKAIPTKFEAKQWVSFIINELPITLD